MHSLPFRRASGCLLMMLFLAVNASAQAQAAGSFCGNSKLEAGETCDDGNTFGGDGCSDMCLTEDGWECSSPYYVLGTTNLMGDPGFEEGQGSTSWTDNSSIQPPNLCNLSDCPGGAGARLGAHWAQEGGQTGFQTWDISQDVVITPGYNFLRFDVMNFFCSEPGLPDNFRVELNGEVAWTTNFLDPNCGSGKYRPVTIDMNDVPGAPFDTGGTVTVALRGETFSDENIVAFDNFQIGEAVNDPLPSVCTLKNNVQYFQPFEGIGGVLGPPDFFQASIGEITLEWGTTDDGFCGTSENPPGNHTGEPGEAACIDSTPAFRGVGLFESYVCAEPVDLSLVTGNQLQFVVNYQPGSVTSSDFFGIWVDSVPFLGPLSAGIASAVFLTNNPLGDFGQEPGVPGTVDISALDGKNEVYVCFGYGNDGPGYAQVDTVLLSSDGCIDDFEEDKLESCVDNCTLVFNPMQIDSDNDGYGNSCDADIAENIGMTRAATANGNDCIINFTDFFVFSEAMFSTPLMENWNPDADLDGNNVVNFIDLSRFANMFLTAPGPSGLTTTCGAGGT